MPKSNVKDDVRDEDDERGVDEVRDGNDVDEGCR